ncbi:MAG TPA: MFS transporter [Acidimicrobiales bacterium]|nr:MFS transporter [Acidimicrobiales bacterium]
MAEPASQRASADPSPPHNEQVEQDESAATSSLLPDAPGVPDAPDAPEAPSSAGLGTTGIDAPVVPFPAFLEERVEPPTQVALHVRLFGSHEFFRLWIAQVVSSLGDWLGFLAITILAASIGSGSGGAAVGLVMSARIIPGFFLSPVAGVLVDRWDRKKIMVTCDLIRAIVICTLPFVHTVLGLVLASLVLEICTLLWSPAKEASVPNLVPTDRLTTANSLSLAAAYGTFPIAAVLFALLAQASRWLGTVDTLDFLKTDQTALAFYVDAGTFALSAFMISTLALPEAARRARTKKNGEKRVDFGQSFHELKEGWRYIFVNPIVRSVHLGLATALIGGGMVVPLGSIYSTEVLGAGAAGYGVFITALGFGVAGGVLLLSVTQGRLPKTRVFELSIFVASGSLFFAASMTTLAFALIPVFVLGVCAGSVYVVGFTLLHENVDDELRGRIFSALYTIVRLCLLIAFALGPFLSELLDRISRSLFTGQTVTLPGGQELFLPGVRLTLYMASLIVFIAGWIVARSLGSGRKETVGADRV